MLNPFKRSVLLWNIDKQCKLRSQNAAFYQDYLDLLMNMKKNEKEEAKLDMNSSNWQFVFVVLKMFYLNLNKTKKKHPTIL